MKLISGAIFFLLILTNAISAHSGELIFSIHPFANPTVIYQTFQPLIDYLAEATGENITIKIAPNYLAHVNTLGQGEAELGFVGPSPYVQVMDHYGNIELLVRFKMQDEINDRVVIITQEEASFKGLADLAGASFAFGDHQSFGSHFMPRWLLAKSGVPLASLLSYDFVRSHDNVVLSVLHGDFAAGGVRLDVYKRYKNRPLKILAGPFEIPPHAIVCRSDLAEGLKKKLRDSLLGLQDKKILRTINTKMETFAPVSDADFDLARQVIGFVEK